MTTFAKCAVLMLGLAACTRPRPETYGFVAVLGDDTTSVERVTRDGNRIIGDAIGRSPTVTRRHWEAELGSDGVIRSWSMDAEIPNAPPAAQHVHYTARFTGGTASFTRRTAAGDTSWAYRTQYAETVPWNAFVYATWDCCWMRHGGRRTPPRVSVSTSSRAGIRATWATPT